MQRTDGVPGSVTSHIPRMPRSRLRSPRPIVPSRRKKGTSQQSGGSRDSDPPADSPRSFRLPWQKRRRTPRLSPPPHGWRRTSTSARTAFRSRTHTRTRRRAGVLPGTAESPTMRRSPVQALELSLRQGRAVAAWGCLRSERFDELIGHVRRAIADVEREMN